MTDAVKVLASKRRWCVTGTPLNNSFEDFNGENNSYQSYASMILKLILILTTKEYSLCISGLYIEFYLFLSSTTHHTLHHSQDNITYHITTHHTTPHHTTVYYITAQQHITSQHNTSHTAQHLIFILFFFSIIQVNFLSLELTFSIKASGTITQSSLVVRRITEEGKGRDVIVNIEYMYGQLLHILKFFRIFFVIISFLPSVIPHSQPFIYLFPPFLTY